jgi:hypothetical protein
MRDVCDPRRLRRGHGRSRDQRGDNCNLWARRLRSAVTYARSVTLTCKNTGGRGRYRTADRWCVNPSRTVHGVSRGAVASWNAQFSGWFVSHSVRGVSGCVHPSWHTLGTTGVWSSGVRSLLRGRLVFSLPGRTIHLPVELRGLEPRTEPGKTGSELRFLLFCVITRVLGFLGICVGVLRDVTVLDRLVWRPTARG